MDTLLVVDTLRDTIWIRDTLTLFKEVSSQGNFWVSLAVAVGTIALATIALAIGTFIVIFQTRKWNTRSERIRVLPLLNLRIPAKPDASSGKAVRPNSANVKTIGSPNSKWIHSFELIAENTGFGPALTHEIHAQQGANRFSYYVLSDSQSESSSFLAVGKSQRIKFEAKNVSETKEIAPHIEIEVTLRNLYGDRIEMHYMIVPFHYKLPNGKLETDIGIPLPTSIKLNRNKIEIPEAKEIPASSD